MFIVADLVLQSSIAIILMGKRELVALLNLSSWCLVMVERLFLAVPRGCLQFVIVVFLIILTIFLVSLNASPFKGHVAPALPSSLCVIEKQYRPISDFAASD